MEIVDQFFPLVVFLIMLILLLPVVIGDYKLEKFVPWARNLIFLGYRIVIFVIVFGVTIYLIYRIFF